MRATAILIKLCTRLTTDTTFFPLLPYSALIDDELYPKLVPMKEALMGDYSSTDYIV
jgi:hypothetical protein